MNKKCETCRYNCVANMGIQSYNGANLKRGSTIMDDNKAVMPEEDNVGPIQRYYYEADMARMERANKRWFYAWLITFILLVGCVTGFIWYESQFEDTVYTVESQTDGGGMAIANATGEVSVNGESQGNNQEANP